MPSTMFMFSRMRYAAARSTRARHSAVPQEPHHLIGWLEIPYMCSKYVHLFRFCVAGAPPHFQDWLHDHTLAPGFLQL